ncbi:hypothetical protein XENOCAPTIV_001139 [Xenoophorus captivus]|uniref:VPS37 C-terminal domain-containing protein n=1 Tax=Xenoophorus captivus TaxID=1517983 RepID=A0ABV0QXR7_9TELE
MSSFSTKFSGYTMTQLNEFLEDDEKLSVTVQEMDEMQDVQQNKEKTLANNRTLAEQNLTLQPQLEHKKEQLTKSYICLQESFESYQLRKSKLGIVTVCTQDTENHCLLISLYQGLEFFMFLRFLEI